MTASLFFFFFLNLLILNLKKMKTELYIVKRGRDSFNLIKGSICWEKICAFQVHSWVADESLKVIPVGVKGKGKFKITIEKIE